MNQMEIGDLWAVELSAKGGIWIKQVRELCEINWMRATVRENEANRMVVYVCADLAKARVMELELKRARRIKPEGK